MTQERWNAYGTSALQLLEANPGRFIISRWPSAYSTALEPILLAQSLQGRSILDIGCGRGEMAIWLAKQGAKVSGIDLGPALVDFAQRIAQLNQVDLDLAVGSVADLPYENDSYDIVVGKAILHHLDDELAMQSVSEAHRVLRKGGNLILFEPIEDSALFDLAQNLVPRGKPGTKDHRPSILQRESWSEYVAHLDDHAMTSQQFRDYGSKFSRVSFSFSGLTVRLGSVLRIPGMSAKLLALDDKILAGVPPLQRYARNIIGVYTK